MLGSAWLKTPPNFVFPATNWSREGLPKEAGDQVLLFDFILVGEKTKREKKSKMTGGSTTRDLLQEPTKAPACML